MLHFLRDAALERRLGKLLEAHNEATKAQAAADIEQAVALSHLSDKVHQMEQTLYRVKEEVKS